MSSNSTHIANSAHPLLPSKFKALSTSIMVSLETVRTASGAIDPMSSPRISFSGDFLDDEDFICISPHSHARKEIEAEQDKGRNPDFEFLSSNVTGQTMIAADELFSKGKLLPFWQIQQSEKLSKISLKADHKTQEREEEEEVIKEEPRVSWFVDDDPSPRPPKCTVLWKELLRLKKQRGSTLSPSSSSSSSLSSSSSSSLGDLATIDEGKEKTGNIEKHVERIKRGLERARSASIRIRPVVNVTVCTQGKTSSLPPLFPLKKGRLDR